MASISDPLVQAALEAGHGERAWNLVLDAEARMLRKLRMRAVGT
jgi:hypothetical protein